MHVESLCRQRLWRAGLRPGDRIGIWAPNCVEWTVTQYAAAKAWPYSCESQPRLSGRRRSGMPSQRWAARPSYSGTPVQGAATISICCGRWLAPEIGQVVFWRTSRGSNLPELRLLICHSPGASGKVSRDFRIFVMMAASLAPWTGSASWPDKLGILPTRSTSNSRVARPAHPRQQH